MSDWTDGYVADIGYTYGYYTELNPLRIPLALLNAGLACPGTSYACEIGFGQGVSINIHAAATGTEWWGTDFNPAQASFAGQLAQASGSGARIFDEAFSDFCSRKDLPDFDTIGLHGIWSWVSDENRKIITDFIRRKLRVGGVVYVSYNTMPGWAAFAPLRELMTTHSEVMGTPGHGIVSRIDGALDFAERLLATRPGYARANPLVGERFAKVKLQNRNYLAHEYFNRDWHPMSFARMNEWLTQSKLSFACSAHYLDHVDAINLSPEQLALLNTLPDPQLRQTVRDFCVNQQFRRDYWIKGARRLSHLDQSEALRALRVTLTAPREDVVLKVVGAAGEANLNSDIYEPLLDLLSDYRPRTIAQLEKSVEKTYNSAQVMQSILILAGKGDIAVVQDEKSISRAKPVCDRLNQQFMNLSRGSNDSSFLASPVLGGGIYVSRFQQLFLYARSRGLRTPEEWANFCWDVVSGQGQRLIKDGKTLESKEENLAELLSQGRDFSDKRLPLLKSLGVAG